jgi:multicomponent Na+:H+ antiporter subunit G
LIENLVAVCVLIGSFFMLIAGIGVFRLGDFYQRIHAPTKAATIGIVLILAAVVLSVRENAVTTKAMLGVLFFAATAPVGAHLLSRAAYRSGIRPSQPFARDDYAGFVRNGRGEKGPVKTIGA